MNKICRICLEEGVLSSIFTRNFNVSLADMIVDCSNVKISEDDGLPEQLCSNCVYKLGIAYHFKQTCESADIRLRQYLGLTIPSKFVDAAVMTDAIVVSKMPSIVHKNPKCSCKAAQTKKPSSRYKRKNSPPLRRGPKPKPKQIHSCFQCDKEFRCQAQLDMHIRTHTGDKPFSCSYCPRSFTQKHNLTIHLRIHSGEKPFQCEVCSKTFAAQGNLQTHLKIHTGQRDHVCSLCNKTFITSSELTRHMSKHKGIKDYKCDICEAAFVQSRDLKNHKQKKHNIGLKQIPKNEDINILDDGMQKGIKHPKETMNVDQNVRTVKRVSPTPSYHGSVLIEPKEIKQNVYHNYSNEKPNCDICGQQFEYLSGLAHHYSQSHKDYQNVEVTKY